MSHMGRLAALIATALLAAGCSTWNPPADTAAGADRAGWTGRTQVIGNNSTVAGNAEATYLQQKWGVGLRR